MALSTARSRGDLVRVLTNNAGLKLMALALAVVLFAVVHGDVDAQRSIYADVVALLPPREAGKMLMSELPTQVKVTVRGSRSKLSELSRDDIGPIQIDLRDGISGYHYIEASQVSVGSGIRVTDISPSMLTLSWADTAEKRVPIEAQLQGALGKRLQLGPVELSPAHVTLRGPVTALARLSTVSTEPVSLLGMAAGRQARRVALEPLPRFVSYVEDSSVEAVVSVLPIVAERTLRRQEVAAIGEAHVTLRPDQVALRLAGPEEVLEDLDPRAVVPFVDLGALQATGTRPFAVQVRGLPAGVEIKEIVPDSVLVTPKAKP